MYNKYKSYYVTIHPKLVRCTYFTGQNDNFSSFKSSSDDAVHFVNSIHESTSYSIVYIRQREMYICLYMNNIRYIAVCLTH